MAKQPVITLRPDIKGLTFDRPTAIQIFGFIRDSIVSMDLLPGQLISEAALANQFGISRTPVREALIQLATIGFVDILPQRGTYVSKFSMGKILEARFIREAIEVSIVCYLTEHVTDDIISEGEKIILEQRVAADNNDPIAFQKLDNKFHQALANHTTYARVAQVLETEKAHMDRVRCLSILNQHQFSRVLAQHTAIMKAIKSGVPEKASKAMRLHLKDVFTPLKAMPQSHPEYFI